VVPWRNARHAERRWRNPENRARSARSAGRWFVPPAAAKTASRGMGAGRSLLAPGLAKQQSKKEKETFPSPFRYLLSTVPWGSSVPPSDSSKVGSFQFRFRQARRTGSTPRLEKPPLRCFVPLGACGPHGHHREYMFMVCLPYPKGKNSRKLCSSNTIPDRGAARPGRYFSSFPPHVSSHCFCGERLSPYWTVTPSSRWYEQDQPGRSALRNVG
jgi:hypothetical protein